MRQGTFGFCPWNRFAMIHPNTAFALPAILGGPANPAPRPLSQKDLSLTLSVRKYTGALALACLGTAASTASALTLSELTWGADAGTTGIGLHVTAPLSSDHGLYGRLGVSYLDHYNFSKSTTRIAYQLSASLRTVDALLDWHPLQGGFRFTGGAMYNRNRLDATGAPNRVATFSFDNATYSTAQVGKVIGKIDFATFAPYLGIGWSNINVAERGWSVSTDLGVMYQGAPKTKLAIGDCTLPGNFCNILVRILEPTVAGETRRLNDELKEYRFFPVVRVGLNYRF